MIQLQYLMAMTCEEQACKRAAGTERMKSREYRELRKYRALFLHRVADTRKSLRAGERVVYDMEHWRVVETMTMFAGPWQANVPVQVMGTVQGVREEYKTETGVQVAGAVSMQSTTVVLECLVLPADVVVLYVHRGVRRRATEAELVGLRRQVAEEQERF